MLELFRSDHFADVSANQWLGLTPPEIVGATLKLSHSTIATLRKDETLIMLSDAVIVTVQHMDDSFEVFGGTIYLSGHAFHRLGNRIELGSYEETPAKIRLS